MRASAKVDIDMLSKVICGRPINLSIKTRKMQLRIKINTKADIIIKSYLILLITVIMIGISKEKYSILIEMHINSKNKEKHKQSHQ